MGKERKKKREDQVCETFEDMMEEGVKLEEKGERYGDGDKAKRFYERAGEMYGKASALKPKDADCLYNWGRILYILLDFMPSLAVKQKLNRLTESISKFRSAMNIDSDNIDILFMLGQALSTQSELVQDLVDEEDIIENDVDIQAKVALQEALEIFKRVFALQDKELRELATVPAGMENFGEDSPDHMETDDGLVEYASNSIEKNTKVSDDGESEQFVTEQIGVTIYTALDTLISISQCLSSLALLTLDLKPACSLYQDARAMLEHAKTLLETSPLAQDPIESKLYRIQIQLRTANILSSEADRIFEDTAVIDDNLYEHSLQIFDDVLKMESNHEEALCDRGDVLTMYAAAIATRELDKAWTIYNKASQSFATALTQHSNSSAILEKLASLAHTRAFLSLPVAERNRAVLLRNAEIHAKQAVEFDKSGLDPLLTWALVVWSIITGSEIGRDEDLRRIMARWSKLGGNNAVLKGWARNHESVDKRFLEYVTGVLNADI